MLKRKLKLTPNPRPGGGEFVHKLLSMILPPEGSRIEGVNVMCNANSLKCYLLPTGPENTPSSNNPQPLQETLHVISYQHQCLQYQCTLQ